MTMWRAITAVSWQPFLDNTVKDNDYTLYQTKHKSDISMMTFFLFWWGPSTNNDGRRYTQTI